MKVFINRAVGDYCGGLVIVAANSKEEAHGTLMSRHNNEPDKQWLHSYYDDIYKSDNWQLIAGLKYDSDSPYVIAEDSYSE